MLAGCYKDVEIGATLCDTICTLSGSIAAGPQFCLIVDIRLGCLISYAVRTPIVTQPVTYTFILIWTAHRFPTNDASTLSIVHIAVETTKYHVFVLIFSVFPKCPIHRTAIALNPSPLHVTISVVLAIATVVHTLELVTETRRPCGARLVSLPPNLHLSVRLGVFIFLLAIDILTKNLLGGSVLLESYEVWLRLSGLLYYHCQGNAMPE
jgi:hypothetical protein